ncbi:hypothetical protein AN963_23200 [Brevibacillus choshinensis]|uniref:Uncharacterized protein n=1 Tax=Brevibacillus choshinensis TaxID=54911 RepID=A0ABR5N1F9_BRECH|nr:hypothetical protein [Brevibacillus choshinensis]KQL44316.1 hypothetical protein AN963_23200 [Brevibacillus choshinensis]
MNRLFLFSFGLMLIISLIEFIISSKKMEGKQKRVISILYVLTVVFMIALQFQYNQMVPTGYLLNYLSPRVKIWIDQML